MEFSIFGYQLKKQGPEPKKFSSPIAPSLDDGATINSGAAYYSTVLDIDGVIKGENDLIRRYRECAQYSDVDSAIEDIVNEAISSEDDEVAVELNLEDLKVSDGIKKKIEEEFDNIITLLKFDERSHEIFRQWYIDGRVYYNVIIDKDKPKDGIKELRYVDPRKIRKIKTIQKKKSEQGVDLVSVVEEYYLFNDKGVSESTTTGVKMSIDSVVYVPSGNYDANTGMALSFLNKAVKPTNQLKMLEDAMVIFRVTRAPERRVFYIDVGNLPKQKAEQYVTDMMNRFKNKVTYDASTGEVRDTRSHMAMGEDFWMPRREGCFSLGTKIKLLDGRDVELGQLIVEHKLGKKNWVYSVSPDGKIVPGLISWAGVTRNDAEIIDIHLDNGEIITATPDHKFILRNGEKIQAKDLQSGSSLMPLYTRMKTIGKKEYQQVHHNDNDKWETTHALVSNYVNGLRKKTEVIHHVDLNRFNNDPDNLKIMDKIEHLKLHTTMGAQNWATSTNVDQWKENLSISGKEFFASAQGLIRRQEISDFNKSSEVIWNAFAKGRETIKEHGYDSISDFTVRNFNNLGQRRTHKAKIQSADNINHKVIKIVARSDRIDVGTLTIDEDHIHHDFHNFALSSGVFVMNSKGTEITTLPGLTNTNNTEDVQYFQTKLFQSLNVPISRNTPGGPFNVGRGSEITRDEIKFAKFVSRLRVKFGQLFYELMRIQLQIKGITTADAWTDMRPLIHLKYAKDNHFAEFKQNEIMTQRVNLLTVMTPFADQGYYSKPWIRKNVLMQTEDEIKQIDKECEKEAANNPMPQDQQSAAPQAQEIQQ